MNENGAVLLRGAVFFIGMALWGSKKVVSLKHPPSTVLPSFLQVGNIFFNTFACNSYFVSILHSYIYMLVSQALENSESSVVAYEVALSLHRLVSKYGREQQMVAWDLILSIMENLLNHLEVSPGYSFIKSYCKLWSSVTC